MDDLRRLRRQMDPFVMLCFEANAAEHCDTFKSYTVWGDAIEQSFNSPFAQQECLRKSSFDTFKARSVEKFYQKALGVDGVGETMIRLTHCADSKYTRKEIVGAAPEDTEYDECKQEMPHHTELTTTASTSGSVIVRCCYEVKECPPSGRKY